jgi:serine/threonine protein kinase/tetratricopeptide (TPR) repeat protein
MTVTPESWRRVKHVFDAAIALEPAEWATFVRSECAGDSALRREVEQLLIAHTRATGFLRQPASVVLDVAHADTPLVESIGPYRISTMLGRGGMGVVYAGTHQATGMRAAIKTVRAARADRSFQIRREIEALARLNHPGIVRILDFGIEQGSPWYAMELVEHPTLASKHRVWSRAHALGFIQRLCDTLAYVHGEGIVHRDLKPANIFVTDRGLPLVADFGLASSVGVATGREVLDMSAAGGTASYMSPEQIAGELLDPRADLYAVGRILEGMVAGLETQDPAYVLSERLLARDPRERIAYAADVASALEAEGATAAPWNVAVPPARTYLCRPPLVGRDSILDQIDAHCFVFVTGESGSGKTRVALEASKRATARGYHVVSGACTVNGSPLHPLRPLLQAIADRCVELGSDTTQRVIGSRAAVLAAYEPALAHLSGEIADAGAVSLPPSDARSRLFRYLAESIAAHAADFPTLVVLDDLQWADELTLGFLEHCSRAPMPGNVRIIGTFRSEERTPQLMSIAQSTQARHIELSRIGGADVGGMIGGMLSLPDPPAGFVRFLAAKSEGNPYFVTEYLRMAVAEQVLTRDARGRWIFADTAEPTEVICAAMPLPQSLRDVVDRRLKALSPLAQRLMRCATVVGREFDAGVLEVAATIVRADLDVALAELVERFVIEPGDGDGFRFVHDKLREIPYAELADTERCHFHGRIAIALEQRHADSIGFEAMHGTIGHHWSAAGESARAVPHLDLAGDRAVRLHAINDAIGFYRAAVAAGDTAGIDVLAVREKLADNLSLTGSHAQARVQLELGLHGLAALGAAARLHRKIGRTWENTREHARALESYATAESMLAGAVADESEWVQIQLIKLSPYYWLNRTDEMTALINELEPHVHQPGFEHQRYHYYQTIMGRNHRRDRYAVAPETIDYARKSLAAAEVASAPVETANGLFTLGFTLLLSDQWGEAETVLQSALAACRRSGNLVNEVRSLAYLALTTRRQGRIDEAQRLGDEALAVAVAAGMADYAAIARATLGWVAWKRGDAERAVRECRAALESWNHPAFPFPFEWMARLVLLATEVDRAPAEELVTLAEPMLAQSQMQLPHAIERAIVDAVATHDREAVIRVIDASARLGLL